MGCREWGLLKMNNDNWEYMLNITYKKNLMSSLIRTLYTARNGVYSVIMYSAVNSVCFSDIRSEAEIVEYTNKILIDMIHIRNKLGHEIDVYTNKLVSYTIKGDTLYITLEGIKNNKLQIKLG